MYWNVILKSPVFVPFNANMTHFDLGDITGTPKIQTYPSRWLRRTRPVQEDGKNKLQIATQVFIKMDHQ